MSTLRGRERERVKMSMRHTEWERKPRGEEETRRTRRRRWREPLGLKWAGNGVEGGLRLGWVCRHLCKRYECTGYTFDPPQSLKKKSLLHVVMLCVHACMLLSETVGYLKHSWRQKLSLALTSSLCVCLLSYWRTNYSNVMADCCPPKFISR